jgi:hypothetical protein
MKRFEFFNKWIYIYIYIYYPMLAAAGNFGLVEWLVGFIGGCVKKYLLARFHA